MLLVRAWLRGNHDARVLLPAMLLYGFAQYWNFLRYLAFFTHLTATLHSLPTFYVGSYNVSLYSVGYFVFYVTILLFLVCVPSGSRGATHRRKRNSKPPAPFSRCSSPRKFLSFRDSR